MMEVLTIEVERQPGKIRGFRIELSEIEAVLQNHSTVSESVVIACDSNENEKHLVAAVYAENVTPDINELRGFISKSLPDYMIPQRIEVLTDIPRNHNGKIDRKLIKEYLNNGDTEADLVSESISDSTFSLAPAQRWLVNHFAPTYFWAGVHQFKYFDEVDSDLFVEALSAITKHHSALRTGFVKEDDKIKQKLFDYKDLNFDETFYDGRHLDNDQLKSQLDNLAKEFEKNVILEQCPLWKVYCVRKTNTSYIILLIGHHLICDMLSSEIIFKDLWSSYNSLLAGRKVELGNAPLSMIDLVNYLNDADKQQLLQSHQNYWCNRFPSAHARFQVPIDYIMVKILKTQRRIYEFQ